MTESTAAAVAVTMTMTMASATFGFVIWFVIAVFFVVLLLAAFFVVAFFTARLSASATHEPHPLLIGTSTRYVGEWSSAWYMSLVLWKISLCHGLLCNDLAQFGDAVIVRNLLIFLHLGQGQ